MSRRETKSAFGLGYELPGLTTHQQLLLPRCCVRKTWLQAEL